MTTTGSHTSSQCMDTEDETTQVHLQGFSVCFGLTCIGLLNWKCYRLCITISTLVCNNSDFNNLTLLVVQTPIFTTHECFMAQSRTCRNEYQVKWGLTQPLSLLKHSGKSLIQGTSPLMKLTVMVKKALVVMDWSVPMTMALYRVSAGGQVYI